MKNYLFLVLIVSSVFAVSAQAGDRRKASNGNAKYTGPSSARYSGGAVHSAASFRYTGGRTFNASPRLTTRSVPTFSQHRVVSSGGASFVPRQFPRRTFSERSSNDLAQFQNNRRIQSERLAQLPPNRSIGANRFTGRPSRQGDRFGQLQDQRRNRTAQLETGGRNRIVGNISPGHNHVFAQQSVGWHHDWDHTRDHWWQGHRCRWVNNTWIIFDIGFIPWFGWPYYDYYAYDYYPPVYPYGYGYDSGASYYGSNYYDQGGYDSSNYNQNGYSAYDQSTAAMVADVQDQLARAGYYHGQIDGVLGPETRHALVRYQSDNGLEPSGNVSNETLRSLGIQHVAQD